MKKIVYITALWLGLGLTWSCTKFLAEKPDLKMAIPQTLDHADLLLNDYGTMNMNYPVYGAVGTDDFYVTTNSFNGLSSDDDRSMYVWSDRPIANALVWTNAYKKVFLGNQVIQLLENLGTPQKAGAKFDKVWGGAHFYRAFAFQQLAEVFAPAYDARTASQEMGIPLRLSPNMDYLSVRASLKETFEQIIKDYRTAIQYLPVTEPSNGRPDKAAAYAGLATAYLYMGDYAHAYLYADSTLQLHATLLDYNGLNLGAALPFSRFHAEVLFPATAGTSSALGQSNARIDSMLYRSYDDDDLRKQAYFRPNSFDVGTYAFKGSYDNSAGTYFLGITTSEIHLVLAESAARIGNTTAAKTALNRLLMHRYKTDSLTAITENDPQKLLEIVLQERRKELVFRGRRWADLKRLNLDQKFARTLVRYIDGQEYRLEPNSLKYAIRIPEIVIEETGMPQNKR